MAFFRGKFCFLTDISHPGNRQLIVIYDDIDFSEVHFPELNKSLMNLHVTAIRLYSKTFSFI